MPTGSEDASLRRRTMPRCHITIGRPPAQSPNLLSCYPSYKRSFLSDTQELTNKGRLHTSNDHSSVTRGGVIAVLCKTHWVGLSEPFWDRKMDLHLSRPHILRYWARTPDQHRQTNRLFRRMRIGAAQRELYRNNGKRFLAPGSLVLPAPIGFAATTTRCFLREPTFGTRETMGYGGLEKSARARPRTRYTWSAFWTIRSRLNFIFPRRATRL